MGRPRTITDEAIKDAAREVFVERGPGAAVSMVAEKLGVSHAALFGRVGSKEKLMLEALGPERPRALDQLAEGPPKKRARERLVAILTELMTFFQRIVPNLIVLRSAGLSMAPAAEAPPPVALRWALARWLERASEIGAIARVRAWAVAEGLLGAMEARCFNGYLGGGTFAPGGDDVFVRELVFGLVRRPS